MSDPKGFLKFARENADKRPIDLRVRDFSEVEKFQTDAQAKSQATRCMDCGVPFCQSHVNGCPVENVIPHFNDLVSQSRWEEAHASLHRTNNFPEFTGRLCPAPCESACVLGINSDAVAIRSIESLIAEKGFEMGLVKPILPLRETGKRVAIVGSGPAGLAASQELRRFGHTVTVFEKAEHVGGLLRYGIPDFKLEKWVIDRRLKQLISEGVQFKTGVEIGKTISLAQLKSDFDSICLTTGAEIPRDLKIPGRELDGIYFAMDYLISQNKFKSVEGSKFSAKGKRVIIIGGGDTGADCLGTVHRQGATQVTQFELMPRPPKDRATQTPWPLWPMKLRTSSAHEEGGNREWSIATASFAGNNGKVESLITENVHFQNGKFEKISGSEKTWPVDLVILAMGFSGVRPFSNELEMNPGGSIKTNANYLTSDSKIFAAGDARRGASLIVWAIAEGRKMANSVNRMLNV